MPAYVPQNLNSFELFGFDIMLDSQLKPWLLEVNAPPALSLDHDIDNLKIQLVKDIV